MGGYVDGINTSLTHDNLAGLKGGDAAGRFHNTSGLNKTFTTGTFGDIAYSDGATWMSLVPGTSGQVLTTRDSGYTPTWETP